jgi:hypothetical protein
VRGRLETVSAATIDRILGPVRKQAAGRGRRRTAPSSPSGAPCRSGPTPTGTTRLPASSKPTWCPTAAR